MGDFFTGAASGVASAIGTAIGGLMQARQNKLNRQYDAAKTNAQMDFTTSERLAQQEFSTSERLAAQAFNVDMWNMNNEYNSPSSQMARMAAAGINPNTAAASLTGASATPVSTSGMSATSGPSAPSGGTPQQFDLGTLISNGVNAAFSNTLAAKQARGQDIENAHKDEILTLTAKQIKASIKQSLASADVDKETAEQLKVLTPLLKGKTEAETKQIYAAIMVAHKECDKMVSEIKRNESETRLLDAQEVKTNRESMGVLYDNAAKQVAADLAKTYKIVVGQGEIAALLSAMASDKGAEFVAKIFSNLGDAIPSITEEVPKVVGKTGDAIAGTGTKLGMHFGINPLVNPFFLPWLMLRRGFSMPNP